jgi:hypothetical protein
MDYEAGGRLCFANFFYCVFGRFSASSKQQGQWQGEVKNTTNHKNFLGGDKRQETTPKTFYKKVEKIKT